MIISGFSVANNSIANQETIEGNVMLSTLYIKVLIVSVPISSNGINSSRRDVEGFNISLILDPPCIGDVKSVDLITQSLD